MGFFLGGETPKVWLITAFCTGSIYEVKHTIKLKSVFFVVDFKQISITLARCAGQWVKIHLNGKHYILDLY